MTREQLPYLPGIDPIAFGKLLWPHVDFYAQQREMILSVRDSVETYVVAGNGLGKDFTAGFICVSFFIAPWLYYPLDYVQRIERQKRRGHNVRIVNTSIAADHLRVLWGEIGYFLSTCAIDLIGPEGPLYLTDMELRWKKDMHLKKPKSYCIGIVAEKPEKLAGHHEAYTLGIGDESSGLEDVVYNQFQKWAKRQLYFGNPRPCANFFRKNFEQGDLLADNSGGKA